MLRNFRSMALLGVSLFIGIAIACASSDSNGASPSESGDPTATAEHANLPASVNDPRCLGSSPGVSLLPQAIGDSKAVHVGLISTPGPQSPITPLSTATPRPGTFQSSAYVDISGKTVDCFEAGGQSGIRFGTAHDFGSDLLFRATLSIPEELALTGEGLTSISGQQWSKDFPLPQKDDRPVSSGIRRFTVEGEVPGRYEVVLKIEWFDLETMQPVDDPRQTRERIFTYYVLPK